MSCVVFTWQSTGILATPAARFFDYRVGDALAIMRFALVVTKGFSRRISAYR